ncbi:hypothetical protein ACEPAG_6205 [Sanghuangporus baumii]
MFSALLLVLVPTFVAAVDSQFRVLHRVYGPGVPEQPFILRATLDTTSLQLLPAPEVQDSLAQFYNDVKGNSAALYQIALQTVPAGEEFDPVGERLGISAVKACHIPIASAEYLTLHLDRKGLPFHVDYYLGGVPVSGACPSSKQLRTLNLDQYTWLHPSNTTVRIRRGTHPPLPELRTPPPLSPKGQVLQPEPEKTFVQKYWIYMAAGLALLLVAGGSPPEEEGGQPAGGR